jgi:hypothetical protein
MSLRTLDSRLRGNDGSEAKLSLEFVSITCKYLYSPRRLAAEN